jgi:hypothetical protein
VAVQCLCHCTYGLGVSLPGLLLQLMLPQIYNVLRITLLDCIACSNGSTATSAFELSMQQQPSCAMDLAVDCLAVMTAAAWAGFTAAQAVALSNITILGGSLVGGAVLRQCVCCTCGSLAVQNRSSMAPALQQVAQRTHRGRRSSTEASLCGIKDTHGRF